MNHSFTRICSNLSSPGSGEARAGALIVTLHCGRADSLLLTVMMAIGWADSLLRFRAWMEPTSILPSMCLSIDAFKVQPTIIDHDTLHVHTKK